MDSPLWLADRDQAITCPLCADDEPKQALLELDEGRLVLLVCGRCSLHFFPALDPTRYAGLDDAFGMRGFELALGFHGSVECLARIDRDGVSRFLEIGCGTGLTLDFARRTFGWEVLGVDDGAWTRAASSELGVPIAEGLLGTTADVEQGAWDLVFACEVIEHVPDPLAFLAAVRAALAPDGIFLLRTPAAERLDRESEPALTNAMLSPGFHTMLHTADSLAFALRAAGFVEVEVVVRDTTLHAAAAMRPFGWKPDATLPTELLRDYARDRARGLPGASAARLGLTQAWADGAAAAGDLPATAAALEQLDAALRSRYGAGLDVAADALPAGAETLYCFALATAAADALGRGDAAAAADAYARSAAAGEAALAAIGRPGAVDYALEVATHRSALRAAAFDGDAARVRQLAARGGDDEEPLLSGFGALVSGAAWTQADRLAELVAETVSARAAAGRTAAADHEARLALALLELLHRGRLQAAAEALATLADDPAAPAAVRASALFHAGYAQLQADRPERARAAFAALVDGVEGGEPYVARARELLAQLPAPAAVPAEGAAATPARSALRRLLRRA